MSLPRSALTVVLVAAAVAGCAHLRLPSRPVPQLEPGDRIRVTVPTAHPSRQAGTLERLTGDSIVVSAARTDRAGADSVRLAFPVAAVTALERSAGVRGDAVEGAVIGSKLGLIAVLLGLPARQWLPGNEESVRVFFGSILAGTVVGAAVVKEDWRRLPLESLRVGAASRSGPGP